MVKQHCKLEDCAHHDCLEFYRLVCRQTTTAGLGHTNVCHKDYRQGEGPFVSLSLRVSVCLSVCLSVCFACLSVGKLNI